MYQVILLNGNPTQISDHSYTYALDCTQMTFHTLSQLKPRYKLVAYETKGLSPDEMGSFRKMSKDFALFEQPWITDFNFEIFLNTVITDMGDLSSYYWKCKVFNICNPPLFQSRAYAFLRDCGCGAILLRHIWKDENTVSTKDTQNVLNVLEEFISETDSSSTLGA